MPGATYTIGRAKENDIVLNDRRVSRHHAHFADDGTGFKIIDGSYVEGVLRRSVNHVFVNDQPVEEKYIAEGDVITIGESKLKYISGPVRFTPAETPKPKAGADIPLSSIVADIVGSQNTSAGSTAAAIPTPSSGSSILSGSVYDNPTVIESAADVDYDDIPLGQTQVEISANEIIGRQSHLSLESAFATPEEVRDLRRKA
jgi:hypothetical protein